jgi:hypothetical protein
MLSGSNESEKLSAVSFQLVFPMPSLRAMASVLLSLRICSDQTPSETVFDPQFSTPLSGAAQIHGQTRVTVHHNRQWVKSIIRAS